VIRIAKEVLTNSTLLVNSVNLSDHTSSITLEDSADEVDFTAFSASEYRETGPGLKDATITATLFNDHAAASVADTLQPLYDSGGTFTVRVKPDLQGTVAYTMVARLFSNPLLAGAVGDANTIDITLRNAGTAGITRGSLAAGTP
jgi:hypothetical protein